MNKINAISFGSVYLDINASGFNFEQAVPEKEYIGQEYTALAGGSAVNGAKILSKFDIKVTLIGKTGQDMFGQKIEQDLRTNNVEPILIKSKVFQTNIGINLAGRSGESIQFVVGTANQSLGKEDLIKSIKKNIKKVQIIYIGGLYKLKKLRLDFYKGIIKLAHDNEVRVSMDHGRIPEGLSKTECRKLKDIVKMLKETDFYFPSEEEFAELWEITDERYPDQLSVPVVLKKGDKGSVYFTNSKKVSKPAFEIAQVSTVGAGDTFNAAYIYYNLQNRSIEDALVFANAAGAMKVSGLNIASVVDVEKFVREY